MDDTMIKDYPRHNIKFLKSFNKKNREFIFGNMEKSVNYP